MMRIQWITMMGLQCIFFKLFQNRRKRTERSKVDIMGYATREHIFSRFSRRHSMGTRYLQVKMGESKRNSQGIQNTSRGRHGESF